jgi:hypothetical protein
MQFLVHGGLTADVAEAMVRQGHRVHQLAELAGEAPAPDSPKELLNELAHRQWCLLTDDRDIIHQVYDQGLKFNLSIVLLIAQGDQRGSAVERLFERYKRLSPRRLYTVTSGRVKVRQLPG